MVNITGPLNLVFDDSFEANETLPTLVEEISLMERSAPAGADNETETELVRARREALNYLEHATKSSIKE